MDNRLRWLLVLLGLAILVSFVTWLWYEKVRPELEPPSVRRAKAMERWPTLVANGFQGDKREISRTFYDCFQKGQAASEYQSLFASAMKKESHEGDQARIIEYTWLTNREDIVSFEVVVDRDPPMIVWSIANQNPCD